MDYRALNINDFNSLNLTPAQEEAAVESMAVNMEAYLQRGRTARAMAVREMMSQFGQSVRGVFS